MMDLQRGPGGGARLNPLANRIADGQLAIVLQLQDRGGRELFRDRRKTKTRVDLQWRAGRHICGAVGLAEQDLVTACDQDRPHEATGRGFVAQAFGQLRQCLDRFNGRTR